MTLAETRLDEAALRRLESGLRRLQAQPLHGMGCFCCGGGLVHLQAAGIEADLLGLLSLRYREAGERALHAAVEHRLLLPSGSLLDWIGSHSTRAPPMPLRQRLLGDLLGVVENASPSGQARTARRLKAS